MDGEKFRSSGHRVASGVERSGQRETLTLLPPDERPIMKWNSNPFVVDGGADGHGEDDGAAFLLRTGWVAITNSPLVSDAGALRKPGEKFGIAEKEIDGMRMMFTMRATDAFRRCPLTER